MSNDEDDFQYYGTLLEPYEEDEVPKKKAFSIEDQVATDEQGRRRFHGAFTGGFSAGFFNTVGSLEGWKPSEFKSSRSEKAKQKYQKPQDFMDDEDVGQFGIAPSVVRATSDFSNTETRKRTLKSDGSIPGVPVLHSILQPSRETVGIRLLKKMGWKPGQGVGPRISKTEKRRQNRENKSNSGKVYGCEIPEEFRKPQIENESSSEDDVDITFAPDDYDSFLYKAKDNTFGMGYSGLDKRPVLSSHINLFGPSEFTMQDHKSNKISISGQAFGVGAFENEDDDIYAGEDMTKYDFELDSSLKKNKKKPKKQEKTKENIVDGFVLAQSPVIVKKSFPVPVLPKNFIPKHGARISRFEPLPETHKMFNFDRTKTMGRHDLSAEQRSKILNSSSEIITPQRPATKEILLSKILDTPLEKETKIIKVQAAKITNTLPNTQLGPFKPFLTNPEKQKRYEEYLSLRRLNQEEKLADFQSVMSEAERDRERYEFAQAARMFKPVAGLVFDKFVAASSQDESLDPLKPVGRSVFEHGTQDMRDAAKKKMFGTLTRIIEAWRPHKLLCKRFNVPDPDISEVEKTLSRKKRNKYSVFDYYEAYKQNKTIKVGPEPKQIETENKVEEVQSSPPKEIKEVNPTLAKYISSDISEEIAPSDLNNDCKINKVLITPSTSSLIPIIDSNESNIIPDSNSNKFESKTQLPTDPKEKLDLFKAIFLSSDESENEREEPQKKPEEKITEMKKILLEEEPKESVVIKPNKGIFADLDWSKINRNIPEQKKDDKIVKETENLFGPKLPAQISKQTNNTSPWKPVFTKQSVGDSCSSDDEWTEVDSSVEKSTKNDVKKHKKHKSKHKKHKSKHKKKKHSGRIK